MLMPRVGACCDHIGFSSHCDNAPSSLLNKPEQKTALLTVGLDSVKLGFPTGKVIPTVLNGLMSYSPSFLVGEERKRCLIKQSPQNSQGPNHSAQLVVPPPEGLPWCLKWTLLVVPRGRCHPRVSGTLSENRKEDFRQCNDSAT